MANLQIEPDLPEIEPKQGLTGWHREFCVELLGEGAARVFVRAVATCSFKATELRLADSARRIRPDSESLFRTVEYEHPAWERVQRGIGRAGETRQHVRDHFGWPWRNPPSR